MNTPWPDSASRVLLVDDYRDSAESMAILLRLWGYQPLVAFDGVTGLDMALILRPDAIFLELRLPGMHGHEVARRIRAEPSMEHTPLLALTSCGQARDRQASLTAGFDHHLLKPVDLEELRHLLAELVSSPHCSPSPSLPAARNRRDDRVVTQRRVIGEECQWADLPLHAKVMGGRC